MLSQKPFSLRLLPHINDINDPRGYTHYLIILDSQC